MESVEYLSRWRFPTTGTARVAQFRPSARVSFRRALSLLITEACRLETPSLDAERRAASRDNTSALPISSLRGEMNERTALVRSHAVHGALEEIPPS
jgi:hypothetical protein